MDNFVVSARKYRPLGFEEVVGQEHITTTLENAIKSNHLGQALLFCGPRGVGKTTCARILAKTINGFESKGGEVASNFNIFELDAASNNSVDDIRNLIDQIRYPPQQGAYKVYIIDEVHMLSLQAFNAFLKTLEEPPEYVIFVLATTEKHKVIPTILSRCRIYDFNRIEIRDIVKQLEKVALSEKVEAEHEALHLIAQKADGALRDALSMFDLITTFSSDGKVTYQDTIKNLHILDYDYYFKLVDDLLDENMSGTLMLFDEVLRNGFDGHNFLNGFQQHLRSLLISKDENTIRLLEATDNLKEKYLEQAGKCSSSFLLSALNIANQFELNFKQSKNRRLHVELCLMKLSHLPNALHLSSYGKGVKKKLKDNDQSSKQHPSVKPEPAVKEVLNAMPDSSPPLRKESKVVVVNTDMKATEFIKEETHTPVVLKPLASSKPKETPSIFNRKKEKEVPIDDKTPAIAEKTEEFSEDALRRSWKSFSENRKEVGNTDKLILNKDVSEGENYSVIIHLNSQLEVSLLEKFEVELVQFLRTELKNDRITLKKEIIRTEESKKLYTSTDIFDYMRKQNPHLINLKDRLGLDFDYLG